MEELARRKLEELEQEYSTIEYSYANISELRERLIGAIGEIDREVDEVYVPRQIYQTMIDEFNNLWHQPTPCWRRVIKIIARVVIFILNLFLVLVSCSFSPTHRISRSRKKRHKSCS